MTSEIRKLSVFSRYFFPPLPKMFDFLPSQLKSNRKKWDITTYFLITRSLKRRTTATILQFWGLHQNSLCFLLCSSVSSRDAPTNCTPTDTLLMLNNWWARGKMERHQKHEWNRCVCLCVCVCVCVPKIGPPHGAWQTTWFVSPRVPAYESVHCKKYLSYCKKYMICKSEPSILEEVLTLTQLNGYFTGCGGVVVFWWRVSLLFCPTHEGRLSNSSIISSTWDWCSPGGRDVCVFCCSPGRERVNWLEWLGSKERGRERERVKGEEETERERDGRQEEEERASTGGSCSLFASWRRLQREFVYIRRQQAEQSRRPRVCVWNSGCRLFSRFLTIINPIWTVLCP